MATTIAVVGAVASAYGAYSNAKQQKKAAKEAAKPKETTSRSTPYGPAQPGLDMLLNDSLAEYQRQRDNPIAPPTRGGGGYSSSVPGADDRMTSLADAASQRALGGQPLLDSASSRLQGMYGGAVSPYMDRAFNAAENFSNPELDRYVNRMSRGSGSRASAMLESVLGQWGGKAFDGAGGIYDQAYSQRPSRQAVRSASSTSSAPAGGQPPSAPAVSTGGSQGGSPGFGGSKWTPTPGQGSSLPGASSQKLGGLWADEMERILSGDYQTGDNPFWGDYEALIRRDGEKTAAARQAALGSQAAGLGRFGSSIYLQQAADAEAANAQQVTDTLAAQRYQLYGAERDRMMQALGLMDNRDQWIAGDKTAREGIAASSDSSRAAIAAQQQAAKDQALLQGLGLLSQNEQNYNQNYLQGLGQQSQLGLAGLSQMGALGGQANSDMLSALGLAPAINAAYYNNYNQAAGIAGAVNNANQQAAAARDAANAANQDAAYQDAVMRYQWDVNHQWDNMQRLYGIQVPIAGAFGTQTNVQPGTYVPSPNPWAAAATAGIGSWLSSTGGGMGGGGNAATTPRPMY